MCAKLVRKQETGLRQRYDVTLRLGAGDERFHQRIFDLDLVSRLRAVALRPAQVTARPEALQVIDRIGARDKPLENCFVLRVVEPLASLIEPVDQRPLVAGQKQPALAKDLPVVGERIAGVRPRVGRNIAIRRDGYADRLVSTFCEELQCGVVRDFLENLVRLEVDPAVEIRPAPMSFRSPSPYSLVIQRLGAIKPSRP